MRDVNQFSKGDFLLAFAHFGVDFKLLLGNFHWKPRLLQFPLSHCSDHLKQACELLASVILCTGKGPPIV